MHAHTSTGECWCYTRWQWYHELSCSHQFCIVFTSHSTCVVTIISEYHWHDGQSGHYTVNGWTASILSHTTTWWLLNGEPVRSDSYYCSLVVLPGDSTTVWQVTTELTWEICITTIVSCDSNWIAGNNWTWKSTNFYSKECFYNYRISL